MLFKDLNRARFLVINSTLSLPLTRLDTFIDLLHETMRIFSTKGITYPLGALEVLRLVHLDPEVLP